MLLIPLWLTVLLGDFTLEISPHWHPHELLGALVNASIAGFLLTAVCAWTGSRPVSGGPLMMLWVVWLSGRLIMLFAGSAKLGMVIDLAFLPAVALLAAHPIVATKQWRQLPILVAVLLLWICDLAFHLSANPRWLHASILFTGALILLVGGRITPAFSRSWLQKNAASEQARSVTTYPWLDKLTLAAAFSLAGAEASPGIPTLLTGVLALIAGLLAITRLLLWRGWLIRGEPLLIILHAGLLWVCIALVLRGLAAFGVVSDIVWLHAMGAGAFGSMILGVMARVALGHTGRALELPKGIASAFVLVASAAVLRVAAGLGWLSWAFGIYTAALCWSIAFAIFLWRYAPILLSPRIDGKEG